MSGATAVTPAAGVAVASADKKGPGASTGQLVLLALSVTLSIAAIGLTSASLSFNQLPLETFFSDHPEPSGKTSVNLDTSLNFGVLSTGGYLQDNIGSLMYNGASCSNIASEFVNSEKWTGCYGREEKNPASLKRNVGKFGQEGFIKQDLPKTIHCQEAPWSTSPIWQEHVGFKNQGEWTTKDHILGRMAQVLLNDVNDENPREQKNMYDKCLRWNGVVKLSFVVAMCVCVLVVTMMVSVGAVMRPKSCFRQSSVLYALAGMVFMMAVVFFIVIEYKLSEIRSYGITKCQGLDEKDYFSKLPADTCRVSLGYAACVSGEGKNEADKQEWMEKSSARREYECFDYAANVFVLQSKMKGDCASQTAVCNSPELKFPPALSNADPQMCFQCTNGPDWDIDSSPPSSSQLPTSSEDSWEGGYEPENGDTCMWFDSDYPGYASKGYDSVKGKSCVNKYESLSSRPCPLSLHKHVFEYGAPELCETNQNLALGEYYPAKYPNCVRENFEMCFVKRGHSEPGDVEIEGEQGNNVNIEGGGDNLGENNCVLDDAEKTTCVCSCSTQDIISGRCLDKKGPMAETHPMFTLCNGMVCSPKGEKNKCEFLGDNDAYGDMKKRWFVEEKLCDNRPAWDCNPHDMCGLDLNGQCISKFTVCNDEQKEFFNKKKLSFQERQVPRDCLTDIDGKFPNKINNARKDEHGVILASTVFLLAVCICTFFIAVAVGAGKSVIVGAPASTWSADV